MGRFPVQLITLLQNDSVKIDNPDIVAITGWTTGNLLNALNTNSPKSDYSFVTLLIGINNQYQGRSPEEDKTQFSQLLSLAVAYASGDNRDVFVFKMGSSADAFGFKND